jgi:hypothetical protein
MPCISVQRLCTVISIDYFSLEDESKYIAQAARS